MENISAAIEPPILKPVSLPELPAVSLQTHKAASPHGPREKVSLLQLAAGAVLALPLLTRQALGLSGYTCLILSFLFVVAAGWSFHQSAAKNLIWRGPDADAFISFSSWAALVLSAAPILFPRYAPNQAQGTGTNLLCALLMASALGLWLADKMDSGGLGFLSRLSRLPPKTARVLHSGGDKMVPVEEIAAGAILHVLPGEQIPLDGVIASGVSLVRETALRDCDFAAEKSEGSFVLAGAVNASAPLWVRVQKPGGQSELRRIAQEGQAKNEPGSRLFGFSDNAAGLILPLALIAALTLAVIWAIDGPKPRAVWACVILSSVLAAACPCALALAEPLAAWCGFRQGQKTGIEFRRLIALVRMRRIDAVVIGKSGILCPGKPLVSEATLFQLEERKKALDAALTVAERSSHPCAQAVAAHARQEGAKPLPVESFDIEDGRGVAAKIQGRMVRLGSLPWLKACGAALPATAEIAGAHGVVGLAWGDKAMAAFILQDDVRPGAAPAVARMKKLGIETILVCGDRNESAYRAAEQAGIGRVFAEALPEEKLRLIERLKSEGRRVAFLGQKFSDAIALCRADIAFSAKPGSPISQGLADVLLEDADISRMALAFELGEKIRKTAQKNIFWALGINAALLPVAAGILYPHFRTLIPPVLTGAIITAQILAVGLNSISLMKEKTS